MDDDELFKKQHAKLLDHIELLEEKIKQYRIALIPILLFPTKWGLARGESRLLAALYTSPDGFRSTKLLEAAVMLFEDGENIHHNVVAQRVSTLRKKLKPFGINVTNVFAEGYRLHPTDKAKIRTAIESE